MYSHGQLHLLILITYKAAVLLAAVFLCVEVCVCVCVCACVCEHEHVLHA